MMVIISIENQTADITLPNAIIEDIVIIIHIEIDNAIIEITDAIDPVLIFE